MYDDQTSHSGSTKSTPWNKNRIIGPKPPLKPQEIWAIRTRLQLANKVRDRPQWQSDPAGQHCSAENGTACKV